MVDIEIASDGVARWVSFDPNGIDDAELECRCTPETIGAAISHLGDIEAVQVSLNEAGQYIAPPPAYRSLQVMPDPLAIPNLPPFYDVIVKLRGSGKHITTINIWAPLAWNGRFLASLGGGNRTDSLFGMPEATRTLCMPTALRNGFATAKTDGGNRDPRPVAWGLNTDTGEIDWELTENWIHRSTHEMTIIAKAVIEAIYGRPPQYSYAAGCSGGGRQALVAAQRYPGDVDGIWSSDPGINWTKFLPAALWPALVMKEVSVLPPAKFEAFRSAAIIACDGLDGLNDGIIGAFDPRNFDALQIVGQSTEAGEITERDAQAMNLIWQGPRTSDGAALWHGLDMGTESWGNNSWGGGTCVVAEVDGVLEPAPFEIALDYVRAWIVKDANWDWRSLTFDNFEKLFNRSVVEMASAASDDPDLTRFHESGGKIIVTHGACDELIPYMGTVDYYRRVIELLGSEEMARSFARLFITEGDGHGICRNPGAGLTIADAMAALMKWVERGEAPDEIMARNVDMLTGEICATRPAYAYPYVPGYRGEGDPLDVASFEPVHLSDRALGAKAEATVHSDTKKACKP